LSSCDVAGLGEGPPLALGSAAKEGSMFMSSVRGFKIEEIAFGRCGTGFAGTDGISAGSREVALRLLFRGDGAVGGAFDGVGRLPGCEVAAALPP
jgi:hypothetical protein